jgi:hypothetical protein
MCKVDGIEVTREERSAWDSAVASFQRTLRRHLQLIRNSATDGAHDHFGDEPAELADQARLRPHRQ